MFEQEVEMEKSQGSVVPLLLIVGLIIAIVGVAAYYVVQSRQVLTTAQATPVIENSLKDLGPVTIHFETGVVKGSVEEKPHDPNYKLLENAGLIRVGKDQGWNTPVSLTPKGEKLFTSIAATEKSKDKDGCDKYVVPIAERKLVQITKINMVTPERANVEFTWKWQTNEVGDLFDAAGTPVKSFNTWDRSTLISKYSANFYHGEPTKAVQALIKGNNGWQIAVD
jgi:hypothetical protein